MRRFSPYVPITEKNLASAVTALVTIMHTTAIPIARNVVRTKTEHAAARSNVSIANTVHGTPWRPPQRGGKSAAGSASASADAIFARQIRLRSALQASRKSSVPPSISPAKRSDPVTIACRIATLSAAIPSLSDKDSRSSTNDPLSQ